jgi:hypothetical protein
VAHLARVYDYWLGGTNNFAAERAAADAAIAAYPDMVVAARANRAFLTRTVRYLTAEAGIRQFLDIGPGIPSMNNVHEVAQSLAPEARIVYADNDPMVLAYSRTLLKGTPQGRTAYVHADVRDTDKVLDGSARTLDLAQPVAVLLLAVLHFLADEDDPYGTVARLMNAVPPGSFLAVSHAPSDMAREMTEVSARLSRLVAQQGTVRSHAEVARFFDGLELVPPGVVPIGDWRPDPGVEAARPTAMWVGVAVKR